MVEDLIIDDYDDEIYTYPPPQTLRRGDSKRKNSIFFWKKMDFANKWGDSRSKFNKYNREITEKLKKKLVEILEKMDKKEVKKDPKGLELVITKKKDEDITKKEDEDLNPIITKKEQEEIKLEYEDRIEHLSQDDFINMLEVFETMKNDFKTSKEGIEVGFPAFSCAGWVENFAYMYILETNKTDCVYLYPVYEEPEKIKGITRADILDLTVRFGIRMGASGDRWGFNENFFKFNTVEYIYKQYKKCADNGYMLVVPMTIGKKNTHANMLFFNPFLKAIERYEPHGARTQIPKKSGYSSEDYDKQIEKHILKAFQEQEPNANWVYISPSKSCPTKTTLYGKVGEQAIEGYEGEKEKRIDDFWFKEVGGYCCMWSFYMMELRLKYPKVPMSELRQKFIDGLAKSRSDFRLFIRSFTRFVLKELNDIIGDNVLKEYTKSKKVIGTYKSGKRKGQDKVITLNAVKINLNKFNVRKKYETILKQVQQKIIDRIEKSKTTDISQIKFLTKEEIKLRKKAEKKRLSDIERSKKRDAYLHEQLGRKQKENLFLGTKGKAKKLIPMVDLRYALSLKISCIKKYQVYSKRAKKIEEREKKLKERKHKYFIQLDDNITQYKKMKLERLTPIHKSIKKKWVSHKNRMDKLGILIKKRQERNKKLNNEILNLGEESDKLLGKYKTFLKIFDYYSEIKDNVVKAKTLGELDKIVEKYNDKNCPKKYKQMKRYELLPYFKRFGMNMDSEDFRGIAPRRASGNVFKPLIELTGVKKYFNQKEQEEYEKYLTNDKDPFDVEIQLTDEKTGLRTGETKTLELRKNQETFIKKMIYSNSRGAIAYWGVGTGKTILAVMTIKLYLNYFPQGKVIFVAPSALLSNIVESLFLFGLEIRDNRIQYYSYERYGRLKTNCKNTLLIIDEAHNLRTQIQVEVEKQTRKKEGKQVEVLTDKIKQGSRAYNILKYCSGDASKVLLLTATPLVNKPYDLENLLAMIDGRMPIDSKNFLDIIQNKKENNDYFRYRVSYYKRLFDSVDFPSRKEFFLTEIMSKEDADLFTEVQRSADPSVTAYYSGQRTLINKLGDRQKLRMVVKKIKEGEKNKYNQNIIYMAFIETGIIQLKRLLEKAKLTYGVVSGMEGATEKQKAVEDYNTGRNKVMIISKAGAEGLDLKNTTNMFVMDMPWNEAVREQVVGRGIRYKSHHGLAEKFRVVNVYNVFLLKNQKEKLFMKKVEEIKNDKDYKLVLNGYRSKMIEEKMKEKYGEDSEGKSMVKAGIIWMDAEDKLMAKKLGMKMKDYYNKITFNKYATQRKLAEKFDPPVYLSIDIYLYIYSKSKQFTINQFVKYLLTIPNFESGISETEQRILDLMMEIRPTTREGELAIYNKVLKEMVNNANRIITKSNLLSEKVTEMIKKQGETNKIKLKKYYMRKLQQYFTNDTEIEVLYKLSGMENDKRNGLMFLEGTAGSGNIIQYFYKRNLTLQIRATEIDEGYRTQLKEYMKAIGQDPKESIYNEGNFLKLKTTDSFDYAVLNPPFILKKKDYEDTYTSNVYDIDFIKKAYVNLRPNGVLVCIMYAPHLDKKLKNERRRKLAEWIHKKAEKIVRATIKWKGSTIITREQETAQKIERLPIAYIKIRKSKNVINNMKEDNEILKDINNLLVSDPHEVPNYENEANVIVVLDEKDKPVEKLAKKLDMEVYKEKGGSLLKSHQHLVNFVDKHRNKLPSNNPYKHNQELQKIFNLYRKKHDLTQGGSFWNDFKKGFVKGFTGTLGAIPSLLGGKFPAKRKLGKNNNLTKKIIMNIDKNFKYLNRYYNVKKLKSNIDNINSLEQIKEYLRLFRKYVNEINEDLNKLKNKKVNPMVIERLQNKIDLKFNNVENELDRIMNF